jgi:hypothetical protein
MKKKVVLCFLLLFFENTAFAEEYRVDGGIVSVLRTEDYVRFSYIPDDVSQNYTQYLYILRGNHRHFRELRIYQAGRPMIFITANAQADIVRVGVGTENCYCALSRCKSQCGLGKMLLNLWTNKLRINEHLVNPNRIIIF